MEKSRRRLRICLFCVILMAIAIGIIYYFYDVRGGEKISEGTLITCVKNWVGKLWQ